MSTATPLGTVAVTSPAPRDRWRGLLADSPGALPEHDPAWTDALCATGRYSDVSRHYTFADGSEALLPMVARRGPAGLGGRMNAYPPARGIGGPVGSGISTAAARLILRDLRALGQQRVGIRPNPVDGPAWEAAARAEHVLAVPRRAHVLDLTAGVDAAWAGVSRSARRNVRLARRSGVRIEVGRGGELLDEYYQLFLLSVDRWAENQHEPRALARFRATRRDPLAALRTIGHHLGDGFCVVLAYLDHTPVAGAIELFGRTGHGTRSAMDSRRMGRSHASELVHWTAVEMACASGCATYHMGESGRSEAIAYSKEKFGAGPHDYVELRIERLPWTRTDQALRSGVKRVIGFRDE